MPTDTENDERLAYEQAAREAAEQEVPKDPVPPVTKDFFENYH